MRLLVRWDIDWLGTKKCVVGRYYLWRNELGNEQ
jgi:hypothetical protein